MTFRYEEIGQRLKAYRLGSGLSADELAKKIGISRTALYRFEQGELAKIDTLERLAELLGVSIPTLLGVGIEYIPSAVGYFERMAPALARVAECKASIRPRRSCVGSMPKSWTRSKYEIGRAHV